MEQVDQRLRGSDQLLLKLTIVLAVGFIEAWIGTQDRGFSYLSGNTTAGRIALFCLIAAAGLALAPRINLSLGPVNTRRPVLLALLMSLGIAVLCAVMDGLFRPILSHTYVDVSLHTPVIERQVILAMRAVFESLIYRLFLGSLFIWILGAFWRNRDGSIPEGAYWLGFTAAQLLNIYVATYSYVSWNAASIFYYLFRYVTPGLIWGAIYRRYGFLTNEIAVGSVHVFLQPLVTVVLFL